MADVRRAFSIQDSAFGEWVELRQISDIKTTVIPDLIRDPDCGDVVWCGVKFKQVFKRKGNLDTGFRRYDAFFFSLNAGCRMPNAKI